eukprot:m.13209 g.13209  ORF g.13209 m.13209 type:complete len:554 (-) comp3283_c0_seq1:207-1868(-)
MSAEAAPDAARAMGDATGERRALRRRRSKTKKPRVVVATPCSFYTSTANSPWARIGKSDSQQIATVIVPRRRDGSGKARLLIVDPKIGKTYYSTIIDNITSYQVFADKRYFHYFRTGDTLVKGLSFNDPNKAGQFETTIRLFMTSKHASPATVRRIVPRTGGEERVKPPHPPGWSQTTESSRSLLSQGSPQLPRRTSSLSSEDDCKIQRRSTVNVPSLNRKSSGSLLSALERVRAKAAAKAAAEAAAKSRDATPVPSDVTSPALPPPPRFPPSSLPPRAASSPNVLAPPLPPPPKTGAAPPLPPPPSGLAKTQSLMNLDLSALPPPLPPPPRSGSSASLGDKTPPPLPPQPKLNGSTAAPPLPPPPANGTTKGPMPPPPRHPPDLLRRGTWASGMSAARPLSFAGPSSSAGSLGRSRPSQMLLSLPESPPRSHDDVHAPPPTPPPPPPPPPPLTPQSLVPPDDRSSDESSSPPRTPTSATSFQEHLSAIRNFSQQGLRKTPVQQRPRENKEEGWKFSIEQMIEKNRSFLADSDDDDWESSSEWASGDEEEVWD